MEKMTKREKVILGVSIGLSVVAVGTAGYFGVKCYQNKITNQEQSEELRFLKFLIVESECLPKARQNGENKLIREENHTKALLESMTKNPNNKELQAAYSKHSNKYKNIAYQLGKLYELEKLIDNDEDIYSN